MRVRIQLCYVRVSGTSGLGIRVRVGLEVIGLSVRVKLGFHQKAPYRAHKTNRGPHKLGLGVTG